MQFAENVKDTAGNGEEYRKEYNKKFTKQFDRPCRNDQIQGMPANRVALYNGILRDRVHRMEYSYWKFLISQMNVNVVNRAVFRPINASFKWQKLDIDFVL